LRVGFYLEALIGKLIEAMGPMECRSPYTFLGLLVRLRDWFLPLERQLEWTQPDTLDLFSEQIALTPSEEINDRYSPRQQSITNLSDLMSATMGAAEEVYSIDPTELEMGNMGITQGFTSSTLANISQHADHILFGRFQFSPQTDFMHPFHLFEGLDSMGGEIIDWAANMDLSAEVLHGQENSQEWQYAE
jgi:hypothetical protein